MFKLIVTGYQCVKYVYTCLSSIKNQIETDWFCQVVIDPSTDKTYEIAKQFECDKIKVHLNQTRQYATHNIIDAVKYMSPRDDDILVWVDLDDWFSSNQSLKIVKSYYDRNLNLLLTYGSWKGFPNPNISTNNGAYKKEDFINNKIRDLSIGSFKASHLKTMKYKVFKNIKECDLKDKQGNWLKSSYDVSFMFAALEMCGFDRIQFIPEILYIYNRETQYNDDKVNSALQDQCTLYVSQLPHYGLL